MVVARLLANGNQCHKQLIELALGNPNGDRTPSPPCGNCAVCSTENSIWLPLYKEGVQLILFDVFTQPRFVGGRYAMKEVAKGITKYPNASCHLFSVQSDQAPQLLEMLIKYCLL